MTDALGDFGRREHRRRAVFIIDEAHVLAPDQIEELRLLANAEMARRARSPSCWLVSHTGPTITAGSVRRTRPAHRCALPAGAPNGPGHIRHIPTPPHALVGSDCSGSAVHRVGWSRPSSQSASYSVGTTSANPYLTLSVPGPRCCKRAPSGAAACHCVRRTTLIPPPAPNVQALTAGPPAAGQFASSWPANSWQPEPPDVRMHHT